MKKVYILLFLIIGYTIFSQDNSLREKPEEFIKSYFETVKTKPYGDSYKLISDNYKNYTGSIREYIRWWDSMESVKAHEVSLIDPEVNQMTPRVRVILGYYFKNITYYEEIIFVLGYNSKINSWQFLDRDGISRF